MSRTAGKRVFIFANPGQSFSQQCCRSSRGASPMTAVMEPSVPTIQAPHTHAAAELPGNLLQLLIAIACFITCFAVVACIPAMMPSMAGRLQLADWQVGVVLGLPMLLGSIGRIPFGILADRVGGGAVFIGILGFALIPTVLMPFANSFWQVIFGSLMIGLPLAVFSVGVSFVSNWYPSHRQGTALGILGIGNIGASLTLFEAPRLARRFGYAWGFWAFAILTAACLLVVILFCRNAPERPSAQKPGLRDFVQPLKGRTAWILSLFYFLCFGGLLAMRSYLPQFLTLSFHLLKTDAGMRAAGFGVLATCLRPAGGWLADRIGGRKILLVAFPAVAVLALFMAWPGMVMFTLGALGIAICIGMGNGAIFKIVAHRFKGRVGTVTGLVGAVGAIGGFFPPLVLGLIRQHTGTFTLGFVFLSAFALGCFVVCYRAAHETR